MFRKILPVLRRNNLLAHITETSRQIRQMFQSGHTQARQAPQRVRRPESVFRKIHVSWILLLFLNSFLIRMTEKSLPIRQMSQRGDWKMRQTPSA